jgi:hypothetical protein
MAAQRTAISRTQRLARCCVRRLMGNRAIRSVGKIAPLIVVIFVLLLTPLGQSAPWAHAAPAAPSCPTWYTDGAAQCQGKVTQAGPPTLQPPPESITLGSWIACVPFSQIEAWFYEPSDPVPWDHFESDPSVQGWRGNYYVWMLVYPDTILPSYPWPDADAHNIYQPIPQPTPPGDWSDQVPSGGWPLCPPPTPPCTTCFPIPTINALYFNFWAYAPVAIVSGRSSCTDGTFQECPPSVGHSVQLWVDRFASNAGPTSACTDLSNVGIYAVLYRSLSLCIQWREQQGSLSWNFDDEAVNPTTGQGQQVSGVNINVPGGTGPNDPVSHTFQYSSAYDPLRRCVRPCSGDLTGPKGSPAFQVSVSSKWWLYFGISINGQPYTWTRINLQSQYGASQPYFTSVTTVPVPVFSDGSVVTP